MAFEAFLEGADQRPRRRRRRLTFAVSLAVHAMLLAGGVAYSFWHVEEITPPTVHVTFMAEAPPPPAPPPPPPAGGGSEVQKKKTAPKVKPTPATLVQPQVVPPKKEESKREPDDDDPDQAFAGGAKGGKIGGTIGGTIGGKIGGKIGGTIGGTVGGTGPKPAGLVMLTPQIGASHKESGEDPDFPALLRRSGLVYVVLAKICISGTGSVDSVSILKGADSLLDDNVMSAVKKWRYRPVLANNIGVPWCYFYRFEFKAN